MRCKKRAAHIDATRLELAKVQVVLTALISRTLEVSLTSSKFNTQSANDVVKLLAIHLEHNRHGQLERSLRLCCDYLKAVAGGLQSKLESVPFFKHQLIENRTICTSMQCSIYDHDTLEFIQKLQYSKHST
jgi:hypothetical protein